MRSELMRQACGLVLIVVLAGSGCAKIRGITGSDDNATPPSPLPSIATPLAIQTRWSRTPTGGARSLYLKLVPAVSEKRIFVAGFRGELSALDLKSGEEIWSKDTKLKISGGPGYGEGLVLVGTEEGEVAAFKALDGAKVWQTRVSSEVLAAPQADRRIVVVRTVDGKVFGLRADDGKATWVYDRSVPALSLRGTSAPVLTGNAAIAGFDSGRIVSIGIDDGRELWESRVSAPTGRTELQRLVDIDAEPVVQDDVLYVVTYQGRVVAMDRDSGDILWRREMSSHSGLAVDHQRVYVTDTEGVIWAVSRDTAATLWRQEKLAARRLGTPAVFQDYLLLGDFEGYVHWISTETGELRGRARIDDDGVLVRPVVVGDVVYVLGNGGTLAALQLP